MFVIKSKTDIINNAVTHRIVRL